MMGELWLSDLNERCKVGGVSYNSFDHIRGVTKITPDGNPVAEMMRF
jgi:hypothetical protein